MNYELSLGLYPGILVGTRSYEFEESTMYVLYIPFVQLMLEVFHDEE